MDIHEYVERELLGTRYFGILWPKVKEHFCELFERDYFAL